MLSISELRSLAPPEQIAAVEVLEDTELIELARHLAPLSSYDYARLNRTVMLALATRFQVRLDNAIAIAR